MLYKLNQNQNRNDYTKVKRVTLAQIGWKEKDFEDLMSNNIQDFISSNDLMVIFTERVRQEEPDIMALDKDGDLYLFELKRWSGKQEHLLQVLRYGQLFGNSTYDELNSLYRKYQSQDADLAIDHAKYFFGTEAKPFSAECFNRKQHFLIVTNGIDQKTIEAIIYWKHNGLNIDAVIYWIFEIANEYYIEFNTYSQTEHLLEYENNCYVLNTNEQSNPRFTKEMLKEQKAAAYYPGWREKIKKLQKGDTVFLYKSGEGIIAYGYASGVLNKKPCDNITDYEYNMSLESFVRLSQPVSAAAMKEITEIGFNFRPVMFSITEEDAKKIIQYIKDNNLIIRESCDV